MRLLLPNPVLLILVAAVLVGHPPETAEAQERVYRVGNSLTWDSRPKAMEQIAAQRGIDQTQAYHINCGKSLRHIWSHPQEVCVDPVRPFGTFRDALPHHDWDAVTIQPYPDQDQSTLSTDTERILDLIELTRSEGRNGQTRFYIYAGWPSQKRGPYHEAWSAPLPDSEATPTRLTRAYFERVLRRVRARTDARVGLVPVGEVLFELDRRVRNGGLDGYSDAHDLYRDTYHLNGVGRFAAALTTFAVLSDESPVGIKKPPAHFGKQEAFTPAVYEAVYEAVETVRSPLPSADP